MGPIGSAVLTFIGYKQTDTKTPKQKDKPKFIYRYIKVLFIYKIFLNCGTGSAG